METVEHCADNAFGEVGGELVAKKELVFQHLYMKR